MNAAIPRAPQNLPSPMPELLVKLAHQWTQQLLRPRPALEVIRYWDQLISEWTQDAAFPLFVRKNGKNRGSVLLHRSGRQLIPTDNSPAHWAFASALLGQMPSREQIRRAMSEDRIPVAMILKASEKTDAKYKCTLDKSFNLNQFGWKVCHVEPVGLGTRTSVVEIDERVLRDHFRKLMTPSNMFVIPLKYAGLGELPEFCRAMGRMLSTS